MTLSNGFDGSRPIPETWKKLMAAGWIHVTGLSAYEPGKNPWEPQYMVISYPNQKSCWGHNNGMGTVHLDDGSIWINPGAVRPPLSLESGAFVPFSNGEYPHWRDLAQRVNDPFWNGGKATVTRPGRTMWI